MNSRIRKLPHRPALLFVTVVTIIIISYAGITFWSVTRNLERELNDVNMSLLRQANLKVDMTLREIDKMLLDLVQGPAVAAFVERAELNDQERLALFESISEQMRSKTYANDNMHSLYLYSIVNGLLMSNAQLTRSNEFFDTGWIEQFYKKNTFSNWLPTRKVSFNSNSAATTERSFVTLVRAFPYYSTADTRKGAIAVNIDETKFTKILTDEEGGPSFDSFFILDSGNHLISVSNKENLPHDIRLQGLNRAFPNGVEAHASGLSRLKLSGKDAAIYYVRSAYNGWTYVGITFKPQTNSAVFFTLNLLLLTALMLVLIGLASMFTLRRWILQPMERFRERINHYTNSLHKETKVASTEHLGYLEQFFTSVVQEYEDMNSQIRDSRYALKWRMASDLIIGYRWNAEKERTELQAAGIDLYSNHYVVMSAQFDRDANPPSPKDSQLYFYGLCNIAEEFMNAEGKGIAVQLDDCRAVFIMSFDCGQPSTHMMTAISVADLVKSAVSQFFHRTVSISIGRSYKEMKDIKISYKESLEALKYNLVMGIDTIISYEDIEPTSDRNMMNTYAVADSIVDFVRLGNSQKVDEAIDQLFERDKAVSPDLLRPVCLQTIMRSMAVLMADGVNENELFDSESENINDGLNKLSTSVQMKAYMADILSRFAERIQLRKANRGRSDTMSHMLRFIEVNYGRSDLSLNLLAEDMKLSVSYLSRMFKEHFGTNFMDYLIQVRIDTAKEMLINSNKRVNEIGEEVGYQTTNSFIRIFKKHTGLTPGEYRENKRLTAAFPSNTESL